MLWCFLRYIKFARFLKSISNMLIHAPLFMPAKSTYIHPFPIQANYPTFKTFRPFTSSCWETSWKRFSLSRFITSYISLFTWKRNFFIYLNWSLTLFFNNFCLSLLFLQILKFIFSLKYSFDVPCVRKMIFFFQIFGIILPRRHSYFYSLASSAKYLSLFEIVHMKDSSGTFKNEVLYNILDNPPSEISCSFVAVIYFGILLCHEWFSSFLRENSLSSQARCRLVWLSKLPETVPLPLRIF